MSRHDVTDWLLHTGLPILVILVAADHHPVAAEPADRAPRPPLHRVEPGRAAGEQPRDPRPGQRVRGDLHERRRAAHRDARHGAAQRRHRNGVHDRVHHGPRRARHPDRAAAGVGRRRRRRARLRRAEPRQGLPVRHVHDARGPVRRRRRHRLRRGDRHGRGRRRCGSPGCATSTAPSGTSATARSCGSATRARAGPPRSSTCPWRTPRTSSRVQGIIREALAELDEDPVWHERLVETPTVAGIEQITGTTITVRVIAKCLPNEHLTVQREIRERVKAAFDANGVTAPVDSRRTAAVRRRPSPPGKRGRGPDASADGSARASSPGPEANAGQHVERAWWPSVAARNPRAMDGQRVTSSTVTGCSRHDTRPCIDHRVPPPARYGKLRDSPTHSLRFRSATLPGAEWIQPRLLPGAPLGTGAHFERPRPGGGAELRRTRRGRRACGGSSTWAASTAERRPELSPHLRSRRRGRPHPARLRRADRRAAGGGDHRLRLGVVRDAALHHRAAAGHGHARAGSRTRIQPIAVRDVLRYLVGAADLPPDVSRGFDIGGPDVLTYLEMMQRYAAVAGLRRAGHRAAAGAHAVGCPATGSASSRRCRRASPGRWSEPASRGGLPRARHRRLHARPRRGLSASTRRCELALAKVRGRRRRRPAGRRPRRRARRATRCPSDPDWAGGRLYIDERERTVDAPPADLWRGRSRASAATNGWYSFPLGLGGARRGWTGWSAASGCAGAAATRTGCGSATRWTGGGSRRSSPAALLRLRAEMRLPGWPGSRWRRQPDARTGRSLLPAAGGVPPARAARARSTGGASRRSTGSSSAACSATSPARRRPRRSAGRAMPD